ncbi:MAG: DNA repair protein RecN [Chloroflexota bacterium]|nr:DNA repair protein RecN [Chloroflexota bacterium]
MLELRIRDFAIIDELDLRFEPGLVVLTGETGAGKSIIVDAVELVLGEWADSTVVRSGADRALIEAVFRLGPDQQRRIEPMLRRAGLEGDNADVLLLGREVWLNRRNVCRVNGRAVTLKVLREVTEGLVDIHGQSEHLSLLRVPEHVKLLDRYGDLEELRDEVGEIVEQVEQVRRELNELRRDERELAHRADLLGFQIEEIGSAALEPGEEEALREERPRLANAERLIELTSEVIFATEEGEPQTPSAVDLLGAALRSLAEAARVDPSLETVLADAEGISLQLEELVRRLRDYQARIEYNPQRFREVEERLALIRRLERKYGETVEEVLAYAERAEAELDAITHSDERIAELEADEERLLEELGRRALDLSERRREVARELARRVEEELVDLHIEGARFGMAFERHPDPQGVSLPAGLSSLPFRVSGSGVDELESIDQGEVPRVAFSASGIDHVEFLVSANPGEPLKPMTKVASGGETSRLMLALKAVLSRADETPTLVFDEIDQGIGGRVGATVGEKLWELAGGAGPASLRHQVLCVTHLAQLAGFGDEHLRVEKQVEQSDGSDRTVTRVRLLNSDERVKELAHMLGGTGEAACRSAEEILQQVAARKARRSEGSGGQTEKA